MKILTAYEIKQFLDLHVIGQDNVKQSLSVLLSNKTSNLELYRTTHYATLLLIGPAGVGKTVLLKTAAQYINAPLSRMSALSLLSGALINQQFHQSNCKLIAQELIERLIEFVISQKEKYWKQKYASNALQLSKDKVIEIISKLLAEDIEKIRKGLNKQRYDHIIIPIGSYYKDKIGSNLHMSVPEAIQFMKEHELEKALSMHDFSQEAIQEVQNNGILVIDDIDKLAINPFTNNTAMQNKQLEICQRQLTELLSGMEIQTKYGSVNSRGLMFVCMGHFNDTQISHLLPELQSKLLNISYCQSLTRDDMLLILTSIDNNLLTQYINMLKKMQLDVQLEFSAMEILCECAYRQNQTETNLGIIRLYSLIDKLFEPFFCHTHQYKTSLNNKTIYITAEYIDRLFNSKEEVMDYSRYIL